MISLKGHSGDVQASTAHKGLLVTGGHDKSLSVWDGQGKLIKRLKNTHDHIIRALTMYTGPLYPSPVVISGSWDGTIKLWNLEGKKKPISVLEGHESRVKALRAISEHKADSPALLVSGGDDYYVKLWDLGTKECIRTIEAHSHFIMDLTICHYSVGKEDDGRAQEHIIISSSSDKSVLAHPIEESGPPCQLEGHGQSDVTSLLFVAGDGTNDAILCSGNSEGKILVYTVTDIVGVLADDQVAQVRPQFSFLGHQAKVTGLCLSNSSSAPLLFSVSSDGFLRSWLLAEREAGAICSDMNEMMGSNSGSKKSGTKVSLLSCASTPTYRMSDAEQEKANSGEENSTEIYKGVLLKASEEVILTGTNGFVLLLSIATLENSTTDKDNNNGIDTREIATNSDVSWIEGNNDTLPDRESSCKANLETRSRSPSVGSREEEASPPHTDTTAASSSAVTSDSQLPISPTVTTEKPSPGSGNSSPSLLAMLADPDLSFGVEGMKEAVSGDNAPVIDNTQDGTMKASSGGLNSSSVAPFGAASPPAQGNGRRAAKALSSTSQARERVAQRNARNGRGGGAGRGRRILQPSSGDEAPMNILLASGPRS